MRLPDLDGRSLLGDEIAIPGGLPAERTLVLFAFRQRQQAQVDRWIDRAVTELGVPASPLGLPFDASRAVVEVPCLGGQWRPLRRFIDGGMASGIGQPAVLARTITVYGGTGGILRALDAEPALVQARVCRRTGEILAAADGEPEGAGWDAVAAALA